MKYKTKWSIIGIDTKERNRLYSKTRLKAKQKLCVKFREDYKIILRDLMNEEYIKAKIKFEERKNENNR